MAYIARTLGNELARAGLVPDACRLLEVVIGVDGLPIMRFEKYLTTDDAKRLSEVLATVAAREDGPGGIESPGASSQRTAPVAHA